MNGKAILAGLAAIGGAAAAFKRRGGGAAGSATPDLPAPDPTHQVNTPPQPSNYDAPGPVANTATPIPAPDPHPTGGIDEAAEEAAAAAEAAAIGGGMPDYPGLGLSEHADESLRPVAEGGGGEAEGQELTEMDLAEAAQPSDTMSDAQRRIEETIEAQDNPALGEHPDPLPLDVDPVPAEAEQAAQSEGSGRGPSMGGDPGSPGADDDEPQTWSGRATDA